MKDKLGQILFLAGGVGLITQLPGLRNSEDVTGWALVIYLIICTAMLIAGIMLRKDKK